MISSQGVSNRYIFIQDGQYCVCCNHETTNIPNPVYRTKEQTTSGPKEIKNAELVHILHIVTAAQTLKEATQALLKFSHGV